MAFKVGDFVQCIRTFREVEEGGFYTITKVRVEADGEDMVKTDAHSPHGSFWRKASRFVEASKAERMKPDTSLEEILEAQEIYTKLNGG